MRLAAQNLTAGVVTELYVVPAATRVVLTANLCNRAATLPKVRLAVTDGAVPTDADWIEYDTPLPAAGSSEGSVIERTGLALAAGQKIFARADIAGVSAVLYGVKEAV